MDESPCGSQGECGRLWMTHHVAVKVNVDVCG